MTQQTIIEPDERLADSSLRSGQLEAPLPLKRRVSKYRADFELTGY
jgi:hypothetical protein